jgi:hypothetical protein
MLPRLASNLGSSCLSLSDLTLQPYTTVLVIFTYYSRIVD